MSTVPRRIVTGHDAPVVRSCSRTEPMPKTHEKVAFHELWNTDHAGRHGQPARADRPAVAHPAAGRGAVRAVHRHGPGGASPMHRTQTVDFGVVLEGETGWCSTTAPPRASARATWPSSAARTTRGRTARTARRGWCS